MHHDPELTSPSTSTAARLTAAEARELLATVRLAVQAVGVSGDEADDLVSTLVERIVNKWDEPHVAKARSRGTASWRGYLTTAARNARKDAARSDARRKNRETRVARGSDGDPLPSRPGVQRPAGHTESNVDEYLAVLAIQDLIERLDTLNDRERTVAQLCLIHGLSTTEVAARLGLVRHTVAAKLLSARKKIRAEIERLQQE